VIECDPTLCKLVGNVATPPLKTPVPSTVAPSRNVTVPVAVPDPVGVTVAVKVTDCPYSDGFRFDCTVVVVDTLVVVTVSVYDTEVLPGALDTTVIGVLLPVHGTVAVNAT
jgi:hypothetical protein